MSWFSPEVLVAAVLVCGLCCYALTAGADFGAGCWVLLATGPLRNAQREFIGDTIAPIWEANHVWLIFVLVILFTAFPIAFRQIMISLVVPFSVLLAAIILRGAAFVFNRYDPKPPHAGSGWPTVFACASISGPFCLGLIVGAIATGRVGPEYGYLRSWFAPMPGVIGVLTVVLFAHLASVYLVREALRRDAAELVRDFRKKAIATSVITGVAAAGAVLVARFTAPHVYAVALPLLLVGGVVAIFRATALLRGKTSVAQLLVGIEVPLIFAGWVWAQYPFAIYGRITFTQAAAPQTTLIALLWTLGIGALLVVPGFVLLFRIFDGYGGAAATNGLSAGKSQTLAAPGAIQERGR